MPFVDSQLCHRLLIDNAVAFRIMGVRHGSLEESMGELLRRFWSEDQGQDIAEYAVMLAVILVLVVGTIRLIGGNANNAFSEVASSIGQ